MEFKVLTEVTVRIKPTLFAPDPTFDPLNASDPGWKAIMPMGGGFVHIPNWQGKMLPEPIHTHGQDLYNIAVFHQLVGVFPEDPVTRKR